MTFTHAGETLRAQVIGQFERQDMSIEHLVSLVRELGDEDRGRVREALGGEASTASECTKGKV